jgi:hypothetical protein
MTGQLRRLGIIVALALAAGLSGCVSAPSSNGDPAKLHQEAQADLARWADSVAAAGGQSGFVPVGELTGFVGDWGQADGNNGKLAMMAGLFEATVTLPAETPPDGQLRWPDGSTTTVALISAQLALSELKAEGTAPCPECVPLQITAARLTNGQVQTNRGPAVAPLWEFTLQGTPALITRVAIAARVAVVAPTWNPEDRAVGISIQSATGTVGGLTLTVTFTGAPGPASQGCGADYTAEAEESATAVVVIVTEHPHVGLIEACTAVGAFRTAEVKLAAPLGDRAVLEVQQGLPVPVVLTP